MDNLYLITGDDDFTKSEQLEKIKSRFNNLSKGLNLLTFDKDNIDYLEGELSTYSFFDEPKLIIVRLPKSKKTQEDNSEESEENVSKKSDWFNESLKESIKNKIETITLVFFDEGTSKGEVFKFVSEHGKVIECTSLKSRELSNWVVKYCTENGYSISANDASYIVELCACNKQFVYNELSKLFDYVENNKISKIDIETMCVRTPDVIVFDLTDGMGYKNPAYALKMLDELITQKEPIQKILVLITRHFKSLLLAKICLTSGKSIEKVLGVKSFAASKYSKQCENFTLNEILNTFKELAKLDVDSKNGGIDLKIGLQKIIMS